MEAKTRPNKPKPDAILHRGELFVPRLPALRLQPETEEPWIQRREFWMGLTPLRPLKWPPKRWGCGIWSIWLAHSGCVLSYFRAAKFPAVSFVAWITPGSLAKSQTCPTTGWTPLPKKNPSEIPVLTQPKQHRAFSFQRLVRGRFRNISRISNLNMGSRTFLMFAMDWGLGLWANRENGIKPITSTH